MRLRVRVCVCACLSKQRQRQRQSAAAHEARAGQYVHVREYEGRAGAVRGVECAPLDVEEEVVYDR